MKKIFILGLIVLVSACSSAPKEIYPYGMTEKEWGNLSVKDQANIRRDFYFYEKGTTSFVNPQLEVEGKKQDAPHVFRNTKTAPKPAAKTIEQTEEEIND